MRSSSSQRVCGHNVCVWYRLGDVMAWSRLFCIASISSICCHHDHVETSRHTSVLLNIFFIVLKLNPLNDSLSGPNKWKSLNCTADLVTISSSSLNFFYYLTGDVFMAKIIDVLNMTPFIGSKPRRFLQIAGHNWSDKAAFMHVMLHRSQKRSFKQTVLSTVIWQKATSPPSQRPVDSSAVCTRRRQTMQSARCRWVQTLICRYTSDVKG